MLEFRAGPWLSEEELLKSALYSGHLFSRPMQN